MIDLLSDNFKTELKKLGFDYMGSGWFESDISIPFIRIKVVTASNSIDCWKHYSKVDLEDRKLVFSGIVEKINEIRWVLDRCFDYYITINEL